MNSLQLYALLLGFLCDALFWHFNSLDIFFFLQVNSRKVDLERPQPGEDLVCHTASNPFKVCFLGQGTQPQQVPNPVPNPGVNFKSRKRVKSPLKKASKKEKSSSSQMEETALIKSPPQNVKVAIKLGKGNIVRCTPEGKRRRHSQTKPLNLEPNG